jgi:hypothetical protein
MYGLPPDIDLSFLLGWKLIQLAFGEHQVILRFNREADLQNLTISVEATSLSLTLPEGNSNTWSDVLQSAGFLVALIGQHIVQASGTPSGTLTLGFNGGGVLKIHDDNARYESYQITQGDTVKIIV